jgi:hypothetical protein
MVSPGQALGEAFRAVIALQSFVAYSENDGFEV